MGLDLVGCTFAVYRECVIQCTNTLQQLGTLSHFAANLDQIGLSITNVPDTVNLTAYADELFERTVFG